MPAVLTPTATQVAVAGGHTVRCATAVFDRLLLGQHWAARPPTRTAKNVRGTHLDCLPTRWTWTRDLGYVGAHNEGAAHCCCGGGRRS
jgi:hypothetical protein